jgi:AcrR family transcriptional regulator
MSTRVSNAAVAMRKAPRQARSRATVEVIVTAGTRVLDKMGWSGFSTNEVARVAGVSIGSVYQYFPNKLALVDAIRRQHFEEVLATLRRAHDRQRSPERLIEGLVKDLIAVHSNYPSLHRTLLDLPNPDETQTAYASFQKDYLRQYALIIAAYRGRGPSKADGMMAQVLSSAIEGVIHNAARRGLVAHPRLKRELIRLVHCYLGNPQVGAANSCQ